MIESIGRSIGFPYSRAIQPQSPAGLPLAPEQRGRRAIPVLPLDEPLDDVPYIIVEPSPPRGPRRLTQRRGASIIPRRVGGAGGRATYLQAIALRAYAPYEDYLGLCVDVWA